MDKNSETIKPKRKSENPEIKAKRQTLKELSQGVPDKKKWIRIINDEGDFREWEYKGYTLRIVRPGLSEGSRDRRMLPLMFHLCGYVKLNKKSPLFGKGFTDEVLDWANFINPNTRVGDRGIIPLLGYSLGKRGSNIKVPIDVLFDVHGGVTYANHLEPLTWEQVEERRKNETKVKKEGKTPKKKQQIKEWWIGFDCGHAGDINSPMSIKFKETDPRMRYYSMGLVKKETERLADQIREYEKAYAQRWWRWILIIWKAITGTSREIIREARIGDIIERGKKYFIRIKNK